MEYEIKLIILTFIILIINLPFGYLRAHERKFSFRWFLYIHLPVPVIILLRFYSDIGFALHTYPMFIIAFFTGQYLGKKYGLSVLSNKNK